jgi:hypothetical protein
MKYKLHVPVKDQAQSHIRAYRIALLVLVVSNIIFALLALHCSRPLQCDDIVWDRVHQVKVCEVTIHE